MTFRNTEQIQYVEFEMHKEFYDSGTILCLKTLRYTCIYFFKICLVGFFVIKCHIPVPSMCSALIRRVLVALSDYMLLIQKEYFFDAYLFKQVDIPWSSCFHLSSV